MRSVQGNEEREKMMMEDKVTNKAPECERCVYAITEYHDFPCCECIHNGGKHVMFLPKFGLNTVTASIIKDSGERRVFETGAVRDITEDKGRCDLMPLDVMAVHMEDSILLFIYQFTTNGNPGHLYRVLDEAPGRLHLGDRHNMYLEVAKHFEEGAKKYGENNWQKGIPVHCYIDSGVRHYLKWLRGDKDERHDRSFVWNIICCIWTCKHKPELNDYAKKDGE